MAKLDLSKYAAMVENAASQVKISSTIFKNFIADIKAVVDGNDDEFDLHLNSKSPHTVPTCRVYNSDAQEITTSTTKVLAFNGELYDTDTMHDNVTNNSRITIKTAGKYRVNAISEFAVDATGIRNLSLRVNGTVLIGNSSMVGTTSGQITINVFSEFQFEVNDYIEVLAYQTSGGPLNVSASSATNRYKCEFMASFISK